MRSGAVVVSTQCKPSLLDHIRSTLTGADSAFLCVAFVSLEGVNLLKRQLEGVAEARLLTTTVFGSTSSAALDLAREAGVDVRVLNPSAGTYHPKMYLSRVRGVPSAVIGSANLTSGLVANVEICSVLYQAPVEAERAWQLGESLWSDSRAIPWRGEPVEVPAHDELLRHLDFHVPAGTIIETLGPHPRRNRIARIDAGGVWIETDRSSQQGSGPQLIDTWMLRLAWDYLAFHGRLTNTYLVADDGLSVKRSSAVCALLAQLPEVMVRSRNPIELEWVAATRHEVRS
jgi:hypothetical protein